MKLPLRKNYKSLDAYLNAVYETNKEIVDTAYLGIEHVRESFIIQIKDRMKQTKEKSTTGRVNVREVIKREFRREVYVPQVEKFKNNAIEGLKTFDKYKNFRNRLRDKKGRFVKFDRNNFTYAGKKQYKYEDDFGNVYIIDFSNSPENVTIIEEN